MKFLVFFIFFEAQSYAETSIKDENIKKFKAAEKALETFNKKYWKPRTNQIFYIKDNMPSDNRVDLENENFNISYSKCFEVSPTQEAANINENNKTASNLIFTRTSKCKNYKDKNVANWFSIKFVDFLTKKEANLYFSNKVNMSSVVLMNELVNINNHKSEINANIIKSNDIERPNEMFMRWEMNILCEGKEYVQYRFTFMTESYDELLELVTTKKYKIPEDFMQIISTFKCRKDR